MVAVHRKCTRALNLRLENVWQSLGLALLLGGTATGFALQLRRASALLRRRKRVDRRAEEAPEFLEEVRRRIGRADSEDLGDQRRVVRNPVAHHDTAARPRHPHHLTRHIERMRREHRPEHREHEVEATICHAAQIRYVALLEPALAQAGLRRPLRAGNHPVPCDVDTEHVGAALGRGDRRVAVAAMCVKSPFSHSAWFGFTSLVT